MSDPPASPNDQVENDLLVDGESIPLSATTTAADGSRPKQALQF